MKQANVTTILVEQTNQTLPPMLWARLTNLDHEPVKVLENITLQYMQPIEFGPFGQEIEFNLTLNPEIFSPDSKLKIRIEYAAF